MQDSQIIAAEHGGLGSACRVPGRILGASQLAALATHAALAVEDDFSDGIALVEAVTRATPDSARTSKPNSFRKRKPTPTNSR